MFELYLCNVWILSLFLFSVSVQSAAVEVWLGDGVRHRRCYIMNTLAVCQPFEELGATLEAK